VNSWLWAGVATNVIAQTQAEDQLKEKLIQEIRSGEDTTDTRNQLHELHTQESASFQNLTQEQKGILGGMELDAAGNAPKAGPHDLSVDERVTQAELDARAKASAENSFVPRQDVGTGEALIPVWGAGKQAVANFEHGEWVQGIANSIVALTDAVAVGALVKTAAGGIAKLAVGAGEEATRDVAKQAASDATRARVLANIGKSRAARESSKIDVLFAKESQLQAGYNIDKWSMGALEKGSIVYGGIPGQSSFYTNAASVIASGGNREVLRESLQVAPKLNYPTRPAVAMYQATKDISMAFGKALANQTISKGAGGATQIFVNSVNALKFVGFIPLIP
jgi:hypothetical protein